MEIEPVFPDQWTGERTGLEAKMGLEQRRLLLVVVLVLWIDDVLTGLLDKQPVAVS